jgi:RimJ/RimL family protein N-acetyltransferase
MDVQIETERLILRPQRAEDLDGWVELMGDAEAAQYIGGVQERSAAWRGMAGMAGSWMLKGFGMFSLIEKQSGRWVGRVGPWQPEGWPGTEVGWGVVRSAWGRGYATEAAVAAIDWAFDNLGWDDVIHCIDPDNIGSIRVAERLGATNRGPGKLPAPFAHYPVDLWGQSREEWRAGAAARRTSGLGARGG